MIRLTLLMSTSRSSPAISTPNANELRIVIRMPNSRNAMKIDSSVKVVRNLRRQMFFQMSGRNFMPPRSPASTPLSRCSVRLRALGGVRIVGDHDDGLAVVAVERLQQIEDLVAGLAIEVAGRLVAEQQRRVGDDGARDADALLLSAGELPRDSASRARPRPTTFSAMLARFSRSDLDSLVSSSGSSTFFSAVSAGSRLYSWNTKPTCVARQRDRAPPLSPPMETPPTSMSPCVGASMPPSMLSSVVLPEPDGPMRARKSPWGMSRRDAFQHVDALAAARVVLVDVADVNERVSCHRFSTGGWGPTPSAN